MITLGIILAIVGAVFGIGLFVSVGVVLAVVGVILALAGAAGRSIGGRPHWY